MILQTQTAGNGLSCVELIGISNVTPSPPQTKGSSQAWQTRQFEIDTSSSQEQSGYNENPVSERTPIRILDAEATPHTPVDAFLIDGVTLAQAQAVDRLWVPAMNHLIQEAAQNGVAPRDYPEHSHWRWENLRRSATATSRYLGIECRGEMQGMLWLHTDATCRLPGKQGRPLAYIERVAVAPWNYEQFLTRLGKKPRFRRCGSIFILAAIQASIESGYEGRIGLHSLLDAEGFYRNVCHMTDMGIDPDPIHEGLRYFEMTTSRALSFIGRQKR